MWGVKAFSNGGNLFNLNVNEMTIYGCSIKATREGEAFVAMPSRKTTAGEYRDIAHPISSQTREQMQDVILQEYLKALENDDEPEEE